MNSVIVETFQKIFEAIPLKEPRYGPIFRGWIENSSFGYKIYLRITNRHINGKQVKSIDIANVEVEESKQNQGVFSSILFACEEEAKRRKCFVFIESILNPIFMLSLKKKGYAPVENLENCLYKDFINVS